MDRKETGGPAFPRPASEYTKSGTLPDGNDAINEQEGMTLRDYFAGQALIGIMSNDPLLVVLINKNLDDPFGAVAEKCGKQADAMIKERNK